MKSLLIFLSIVFSFPLYQKAAGVEELKAEVKALDQSAHLAHGQWAFVVQETESGKVLLDHQGKSTLLPASTLKTITSAAALGVLGPDFRFKTVLETDGEVVDGVLKGNLYIKGGGDPSLGSDRFGASNSVSALLENAIRVIRAKGIRSIDGSIVGDASIYNPTVLPMSRAWSDMGNYYGAGASGLSIAENTYQLYFKPNATVGEEATFVRTEPELPGITWINEMKTGRPGSGDQGYIYGAPYTDVRYLRGSIPQGKAEFSIKGSFPEPALYAAQALREALVSDSIPVTGRATTLRLLQVSGEAPSGKRQELWAHASPRLKDIVYWLNKKSVNLFAEHLLRHLGLQLSGKSDPESGAEAVVNWWKGKGIDVEGLYLADGSGLSRSNGVTAQQLTAMLRYNAQQDWFEAFFNSLPVAGEPSDPGSLRSMCKGTAAAGNLRAKSGYISRVRAYTGYVDTRSGKQLAFAMIANNFTCSAGQMRRLFEPLMVKMAELD